jgi:hypothetical protein
MSDQTSPSEFEGAVPRASEPIARAIEIAERQMGDRVEGVGQGATPDGRECVTVMVARLTPELKELVPREIEGFPVQIVETSIFQAGG